jgi:hypothetical protein
MSQYPPALLGALGALAACTPPLELDDRQCPCAAGYHCCGATCVPEIQICPGEDASSEERSSPEGAVADDVQSGSDAPETNARQDAAGDAGPEAAPETDGGEAVDAGPIWKTLGLDGLRDDLVAEFDLEIAADGTPFLGLSNLIPGAGRARTSLVRRYDGTGWQKVGDDLNGSTLPLTFALLPDGTPYILADAQLKSFQKGAWQDLPSVGPDFVASVHATALGVDRSGRLYVVAGDVSADAAFDAIVVLRFTGTGWEELGPRGALVSAHTQLMFGFDASSVYVAIPDPGAMTTVVKRYNGSNWETVGDGPLASGTGSFAVAADGVAYFAWADANSVRIMKSSGGPWGELAYIPGPYNVSPRVPSIDLGSDGTAYIASLFDRDPGPDIVPLPAVMQWSGTQWIGLTTTGLEPSVFDAIKLRVGNTGGRAVPYMAYLRENRLIVKKLQ